MDLGGFLACGFALISLLSTRHFQKTNTNGGAGFCSSTVSQCPLSSESGCDCKCPSRVGAQSGLGPIWALVGPYGPRWALMGPPGQVLDSWTDLDMSGFGFSDKCSMLRVQIHPQDIYFILHHAVDEQNPAPPKPN